VLSKTPFALPPIVPEPAQDASGELPVRAIFLWIAPLQQWAWGNGQDWAWKRAEVRIRPIFEKLAIERIDHLDGLSVDLRAVGHGARQSRQCNGAMRRLSSGHRPVD
jgi:hypothetical protein